MDFNAILEWCGDKINYLLSLLCSVLPDSPFSLLDNSPIQPYLSAINYFIPVAFMVDTLAGWLAAILIYYGVSIIMRWIKALS